MKKNVLVHTCHPKTEIRDIRDLDSKRKYYSDDPKFRSFQAVPLKCACKKMVTLDKSKFLVEKGIALRIYRPREGRPLNDNHIDWFQVIMVVNRAKTPRVDLITQADMERAYVDCLPHYIEHIENIHDMIMSERAKLIVPFRPDPCEGRLLFPFGPDQRTVGGH
jgi:hypothetical protein